jgi:hypothetical protein
MSLSAILMVAMAGVNAWAGDSRAVTVCVSPGDKGHMIRAAEIAASRIFGRIGVVIDWRARRDCPSSSDVIKVTLSEWTPREQYPDALAYALPYERTHVVVFYDRVQKSVEFARVPLLLGYVMVHEITHILQGIRRHSKTGIMKAQVGSRDYDDIVRNAPEFDPYDVDLIYRGLDRVWLAIR